MTSIDATTVSHLQAWIGKQQVLHDKISVMPLSAWSATLDRDDPTPDVSTALPPLTHWLYFLPIHLQRDIAQDGHPHKGGFLPPVPLPRRMWAGGRLHWHQNVCVGEDVKRISEIKSVTHKSGKSGDLIFVTVQHNIHNNNGLCLTEEHDIVYRPPALATDPVPTLVPAPTACTYFRDVLIDEVVLFRYSALTFNGHRIHYDKNYVRQVENYPGLIVHGPLIATLLTDLIVRNNSKALRSFSFKAVRPTFLCDKPLTVHVSAIQKDDNIELWAQDEQGFITMQATAQLV